MTASAKSLFRELVSADDLRGLESRPVDADEAGQLLEIVERHTGVTADEIDSVSRQATICRARFLVYTLLRSRGYSYSAIARWATVDHSSVIYGINVVSEWTARSDEACKLLTVMLAETEGCNAD